MFFFPDPAPPPRPPLPSDGDYVPPSRPPPPALDTTDDESEDLFQTTPTASQGPIMVRADLSIHFINSMVNSRCPI